jgi:glycosyltransferase involved in cell wall biosynthesis
VRALIDYRPALRARTGAGEYIRELARAAARTSPKWDVSIFTASWKDRPAVTLANDLGVKIVDRRVPGKLLNLLWHRLEWPPIEQIAGSDFDVVHAAHPLAIPARRAARVVTIHDLDFLHHPERTRAEIRRDYPALTATHAARADRIVTSSQFTASEIARDLHVAADKITVCPAGVPDWSGHAALPAGVPAGPYILFLGTLEPRKNVAALLDAYERLLTEPRRPPALVVAGGQPPSAAAWVDRAGRPPLAGHVVCPGYIAPESRRALYEHAALFVLPSHHEGFGMPVLEAMSLGVPVVASRRGSLPEVLGDAGILVDPDDTAALAAAIKRVLEDRSFADGCRTRGLQRARTFTWASAAARLIEAYELAVEARRRRRADGTGR